MRLSLVARPTLVDHARRKHALKLGGDSQQEPLDEGLAVLPSDDSRVIDLVALDDALAQFETIEPVKAQLAKLRYFAGLSLGEAAKVLDISARTARRHWVYARSRMFGMSRGE